MTRKTCQKDRNQALSLLVCSMTLSTVDRAAPSWQPKKRRPFALAQEENTGKILIATALKARIACTNQGHEVKP
jgi:hypothetical protein